MVDAPGIGATTPASRLAQHPPFTHSRQRVDDWSAFYLAQDVAPLLQDAGWQVGIPSEPERTPATAKPKDPTQSYEPDPVAGIT